MVFVVFVVFEVFVVFVAVVAVVVVVVVVVAGEEALLSVFFPSLLFSSSSLPELAFSPPLSTFPFAFFSSRSQLSSPYPP